MLPLILVKIVHAVGVGLVAAVMPLFGIHCDKSTRSQEVVAKIVFSAGSVVHA